MTKERDKKQISTISVLWEQYKKANWYESDAIDVEKYLIDKFIDSFLATLPEEKEESKWISIEDMLPQTDVKVLVRYIDGQYFSLSFNKYRIFNE